MIRTCYDTFFFNEGPVSKTFIVLCYNNNAEINDLPIYEPFQQAHHEFIHHHDVEFYVMDCDTVLPDSGKTISNRFNLDTDKHQATLFMSGNTGLPVEIPPKYHKKSKILIQYIKTKTTPLIHKIKTSKDFKTKCLSKNMCGLILKPRIMEKKLTKTIKKLMKEYKDVKFCSVESEHVLVPHVEEYIPLYEGKVRFVVFQREYNKDKSVVRFVYLEQEADYKHMNQLLKKMILKSITDWRKLPILPYIQTRSKKNEQLDLKKRERLKKQQERLQGELKNSKEPGYKEKIREKNKRKLMMEEEEVNKVEGRNDINDGNVMGNEDITGNDHGDDNIVEDYEEEDVMDLD